MKLTDSISTYDVAEGLQVENGKFEATSPNGPYPELDATALD